MANALIWPPHIYGHFILAQQKLSQLFSYLKNPFKVTQHLESATCV